MCWIGLVKNLLERKTGLHFYISLKSSQEILFPGYASLNQKRWGIATFFKLTRVLVLKPSIHFQLPVFALLR